MMKEIPIHFQDKDSDLAGVMVLPSGKGPHPAVIFIHGSGPENQDGGGLYRQMWKHLTEQGFCCFSWDKPGVGASTGNWKGQNYEERAQEALAAMYFLQTQKYIDPSRIGLWGLSEGGLVCTLAAALNNDVAFIIPVSSPAGSLIERELFTTEARMRAEKVPEDAIKRACDVTLRELELVSKGASLQEIKAVSKAVENEPWFKTFEYINYGQSWTQTLLESVKNHMMFDSESVLERIKCPVLAIWGELDTTVPAEKSHEIFKNRLVRSGNRDVTLRIFPKADHALFPTVTGGMREMLQSWKELKPLLPNYLKTMTEWLKERFLIPYRNA